MKEGATNESNEWRKGYGVWEEALQKLNKKRKDEYLIVICGADEQKGNLSIANRFIGYVRDHYILQSLYSAADVMIVPSLEEAFGQTVTESMACMTPVVSFFETGPAGIIEHKETGYLAKYGDVEDLAVGIEWVLEDPARLNALSKSARHRIEITYDIKVVAEQYRELYEQIEKDA